MTLSDLVQERAELLARLEVLEAAIEAASTAGTARRISTRRNLRNTGLHGVPVYMDESMTQFASVDYHGGWISGDDAAYLLAEGLVDGDYIRLES